MNKDDIAGLVARLRNKAHDRRETSPATLTEAADALTTLSAENERLEAALLECERKSDEPTTVEMIARQALAGGNNG